MLLPMDEHRIRLRAIRSLGLRARRRRFLCEEGSPRSRRKHHDFRRDHLDEFRVCHNTCHFARKMACSCHVEKGT